MGLRLWLKSQEIICLQKTIYMLKVLIFRIKTWGKFRMRLEYIFPISKFYSGWIKTCGQFHHEIYCNFQTWFFWTWAKIKLRHLRAMFFASILDLSAWTLITICCFTLARTLLEIWDTCRKHISAIIRATMTTNCLWDQCSSRTQKFLTLVRSYLKKTSHIHHQQLLPYLQRNNLKSALSSVLI